MTDFCLAGPDHGPLLLLAHGAGAAMTSPFMETFAGLLAERGLASARFEFAYMAARREGGKRRPPPKAETLVGEYETALSNACARWPGRPLLIGGKSMGGRVASYIAQAQFEAGAIRGLVCLGYPFHPPAKPESLRTAHLLELGCPTLIVQGERDPFGGVEEVAAYGLPPSIAVAWARDGDHDLAPRRSSGVTLEDNLAMAAGEIARFAERCAQTV
jgi:predicted alpha/beta-hydrolase family hydrolase